MKTIATVAATLLLSLGVMTSPAAAQEPHIPPAECVQSDAGREYVAHTSEGLTMLRTEIAGLRSEVHRLERRAGRQAETIARLRDRLASR